MNLLTELTNGTHNTKPEPHIAENTDENALKTSPPPPAVWSGGAPKVIKIDGIIIVNEIVYPIEKVQNTTESNRKTLVRCT